MIKSIKVQTQAILERKLAVVTFFLLVILVLINFTDNMFENRKIHYVSQMYDLVKTSTLSFWSLYGSGMMMYYPLIVVLPTSCTYLFDKNSKINIYMQMKIGKRKYLYGKAASVFLATFLIFTIPFLMEILLSCICFDVSSMGDPSNFDYLYWIEDENKLFLSGLWMSNRIIYAVLMIMLFGMVSGVLALFNFSLSILPIFKYKVFTFFPVFLLFEGLSIYSQVTAGNTAYTTNYYYILRMFTLSEKNYGVYAAFLIVLLVISFFLLYCGTKRDEIS